MSSFASLKLSHRDTLNMRSTRNSFLKGRDGKLVNLLQQGFMLLLNEQGFPSLQLIVVTDITSFNSSRDHFYSLTLTKEDGTQQVLLSEKLEKQSDIISPREREVLRLLCQGHSSEEIALQLTISVETVKTHRKNLLEKTNSENSIDLARYSFAQGWL